MKRCIRHTLGLGSTNAESRRLTEGEGGVLLQPDLASVIPGRDVGCASLRDDLPQAPTEPLQPEQIIMLQVTAVTSRMHAPMS